MTGRPLLHVEEHAGHGPHLLLVHGFLSSRANWLPNLPALAEVTRPTVVELWAHGRSPAPTEDRWYEVDAYVEAFEEVRRRIGCERWFICGHSLGASLTLRYALTHPERIIGHVLMNSSSAAAPAPWTVANRHRFEAEAAALASGGVDAIRSSRLYPGRVRGLSPEVADALHRDAERHDGPGLSRTVLTTSIGSSSHARLDQNTVPTLLVVGRREQAFEPVRRELEQALPQLEVVEVEAGHAVNLEATTSFDRAVTDFVVSRSGDDETRDETRGGQTK